MMSYDEIAAFDLMLEGVTPSQVHLLLDENDWQMATRQTATGTRLIVFSLNGATLPVGTATQLLQIDGTAMPVSVQASSPLATTVGVTLSAQGTTGILEMADRTLRITADSDGLLLTASTACGPMIVSIHDVHGRLIKREDLETLPAGTTRLPMNIRPADGFIIVTVSGESTGPQNYKLQIAK